MLGSLSHLARVGLTEYAPALVDTMTRLAGRAGQGVSVIPLVPVPVGGVGSETLIRDMMDLDSWILSTEAGQSASLPDSRVAFWKAVARPCGYGGNLGAHSAARILSLPGGICNPRKRSFVAGSFTTAVPVEIPPLCEDLEEHLVTAIFDELNEKFCVGLDCPPSCKRTSLPPQNVSSNRWTVFVGGSILGKIAEEATKLSMPNVKLTFGCWTTKPVFNILWNRLTTLEWPESGMVG